MIDWNTHAGTIFSLGFLFKDNLHLPQFLTQTGKSFHLSKTVFIQIVNWSRNKKVPSNWEIISPGKMTTAFSRIAPCYTHRVSGCSAQDKTRSRIEIFSHSPFWFLDQGEHRLIFPRSIARKVTYGKCDILETISYESHSATSNKFVFGETDKSTKLLAGDN